MISSGYFNIFKRNPKFLWKYIHLQAELIVKFNIGISCRKLFMTVSSVSDPHRFYADPDPDSAFLLDADPDPDPTCRI
jgi:hypothetical protein